MFNFGFSRGDLIIDDEDLERVGVLSRILDWMLNLIRPTAVFEVAGESGRAGRLWGRAGILIVISILSYLPCLYGEGIGGEFDLLRHTGRPELAVGSLPELGEWFVPGRAVPMALRWALDLERGPGGSAGYFGVTAVLLHAAAVVLVWLILRRLEQRAAWLAAALFAVHPAGVPAVAWITQQGRVWAAVLSLSGLLLLLINRGVPSAELAEFDEIEEAIPSRGQQLRHAAMTYTGAVLAFVLAALFQPTAAVVALIGVVLVVWKKRVSAIDWIFLAPLILWGVVWSAVVIAGNVDLRNGQWFPGLISEMRISGRIILDSLLLHPGLSSWTDAGPRATVVAVATSLGVIVWIATPILLAWRRRFGSEVAAAAVCFLLLLPTAVAPLAVHVFTPSLHGLNDLGEVYLCEIPLLVIISNLVVILTLRVRDEIARGTTQLAVGFGMLVPLIVTTIFSASAFGETEKLLKAMVSAESTSGPARSRLAKFYLSQTPLTSENIKSAETAVKKIGSGEPETCNDAGIAVVEGDVLQAGGADDAAIRWYLRGEALGAGSSSDLGGPEAAGHLAALYVRLNRNADATACYEKAIQLFPDAPALRNDFALLLGATGRLQEAIVQLNDALRVDPDYVPAHVNLANDLIAEEKFTEAAAELNTAVTLDPDNFEAFHNAGIVLARLGDSARAIQMLTAAVQLRPQSVEARNDLGVALVAQGRFSNAIFEFREALTLMPDYAAAKHNLEVAQRKLQALEGQKTPASRSAPTTRASP